MSALVRALLTVTALGVVLGAACVGLRVNPKLAPPLVAAARRGDLATVDGLLRRGADVDQTDDLGRTALIWAAFEGRVDLLRTLIARGADVTHKDIDGATALTMAATVPQPEAVRLLLGAGADVHARSGEAAWTPLMGAVWVRCAGNLRVLAQGGADLHACDLRGRTCLRIAKEAQYPDMVELLHRLGAKE